MYPCAPRLASGEVAEWSKALDWNSSYIFTGVRGFESHPLRQTERNAPVVGRFRSRRSRAAMKGHLGLLPLAALALLACTQRPSPERIAGETMGTTYEVVVTHRPASLSRAAIRSRRWTRVLAEVNGHLSGWDAESELARFNAANGTDWVPASSLLVEAVDEAQAVSRASGGAFDVTVSPLVRAWGFGAGAVEEGAAPAPAELERLQRVGRLPEARVEGPPACAAQDRCGFACRSRRHRARTCRGSHRRATRGARRPRLPRGTRRRSPRARPQPGGPAMARGGRGTARAGAPPLCARRTRWHGCVHVGRLSGLSRDRTGDASRTRSIHARRPR